MRIYKLDIGFYDRGLAVPFYYLNNYKGMCGCLFLEIGSRFHITWLSDYCLTSAKEEENEIQ